MLLELSIRNFAIIDKTRIPFQSGLNALTGETGAGKSILIDALGAVLGERIGSDVVRDGARSATVDATFYVVPLFESPAFQNVLEELGVEPEDDVLILSREISASGRGSARINGRSATASALSRLGSFLVDIHGQSDHLSLLRASNQLDLLDRFAGVFAEREQLAVLVRTLRAVRGRISTIAGSERERARQIDLLTFQLEEITASNLQTGEDVALDAERSVLMNAEQLMTAAAQAYDALQGIDETDGAAGAIASLQLAVRALEEMATMDGSQRSLAERARELEFLLQDIAADVRGYRDEIAADPARLLEIEERLDQLRTLQRKYGATIEEVIAFGEAAARELQSIEQQGGDVDELRRQELGLQDEAERLALALSGKRQKSAAALGIAVERALAELNMGSSRFAVQVTPAGAAEPLTVEPTGIDRVEFLLAPHGGDNLRPLARVASGGETARLMLALKSILSAVDETPVLVFDEIDVGVGGRSGHVVGEKLWDLARDHQVIVVSHLPQIAAFAESHFRINKQQEHDRVVSRVSSLDNVDRIDELAAMLDGVPVTAAARANANEMLSRAIRWKQEHVPEPEPAGG